MDAGVTFMDNAWEYHDGKSEEMMGQALAGRRGDVFLMTTAARWPTAARRRRPTAASSSTFPSPEELGG